MTDDKNLRQSLIAAFEHLKAQDALISTMQCHLFALQESLLEGNAQALVLFEEALARQAEAAVPKIASSSQVFDSIIEQLKSGGWLN